MCNQMAGNWEFVIPGSMQNTLSTILILGAGTMVAVFYEDCD